MAEVHQTDCVFHFDYSKVYWNSRLETEHTKMINSFERGSIVCDAFAGADSLVCLCLVVPSFFFSSTTLDVCPPGASPLTIILTPLTTVPRHWAVCDPCGQAPGLPGVCERPEPRLASLAPAQRRPQQGRRPRHRLQHGRTRLHQVPARGRVLLSLCLVAWFAYLLLSLASFLSLA